jgi:predicted AlkP superfamily pyrophosphatase or phosphodiesterase
MHWLFPIFGLGKNEVMVKNIFLLFLGFLLIIQVSAQPRNTKGSSSPRLVLGIVVEQMRVDYIDKYWSTFQNDGFKRLVNNGAVCQNARIDIHNIRASTGSATIATGTWPSAHGIVGDRWYSQLTREFIHAVNNEYYLTLGSDSKEGSCSAGRLKVATLGDALKQATNMKSKVFSVGLNAASSIFLGGHAADGVFWFDQTNGNMISSSYYYDKFPVWVQDFNSKAFADEYLKRQWELLLPAGSYNAGFEDAYILEKGFFERWNKFPYNLSRLRERTVFPFQFLKATPFGNKLVRDFAVQLIEQEKLGHDEYPDLLNITFSSLDFANHWFGPGSVEMHDLYLRLDQEIASILEYLDRKLGKDNYLVYLTSSSTSGYSVPVLKDEFRYPAGEFSPQSAMALLRAYLNAVYGVGEWIVGYNEEHVYLNHFLIERENKPLHEMQEKTALFLNQFEGVKSAVPAWVVETGNMSNSRFELVDKSFFVKRSGDVVIQLEEWWQPAYKFQQVDFSVDQRVPLVFYGMNVKPGSVSSNVSLIDIVPTICDLLGIMPPDKASGIVITKNIDLE